MTYEELLEMLNEMHPEVDFENEDSLIDGKVLTSFDIVAIIAELSSEHDVSVSAGDIIPENFNSAKAMYELIKKSLDED